MRSVLLALSAFLMTSEAPAQTGADPFLRDVRGVADATAGRRVGNGDHRADKVVAIGRNAEGNMIVTGLQVLASGASNSEIRANDRAVALLRTREATPQSNRAPHPDDIAYVRQTGMRLFIVGEWSRPPVIWEIERNNDAVRLRTIGADGAPGPWEAPAG